MSDRDARYLEPHIAAVVESESSAVDPGGWYRPGAAEGITKGISFESGY